MTCLGDGHYEAVAGKTIEETICCPGTRVELLRRIDHWIRDTSISSPVLWICGTTGSGKSTIVSTLVHNWKCRASCAVFHFRRGQTTLSSHVICALARQLGDTLATEVRNAVLGSVLENQDVATRTPRLDEQFGAFLVTPFSKLKHRTHPILIVVDGLDECHDPKIATDLARLIHQHSPSFPYNVKFLLTSGPKASIIRDLESRQWRKEDLDSAPNVNNDITRFLETACTPIRQKHNLSTSWPSSQHIATLAQKAGGLFQCARAVIAYISYGSSPIPRLLALLTSPSLVWNRLRLALPTARLLPSPPSRTPNPSFDSQARNILVRAPNSSNSGHQLPSEVETVGV